MLSSRKKVLILTGPSGSGKTTVAELLAERAGFTYVDGDALDSEFFPVGGQWEPENVDKIRLAHEKILAEVRRLFDNGKMSVVLDYVIFDDFERFFEMFRNEFGDSLEIKVLYPAEDENLRRDAERTCWTTGPERITDVRSRFAMLKELLGQSAFIDSTGQTPEETVTAILSLIHA